MPSRQLRQENSWNSLHRSEASGEASNDDLTFPEDVSMDEGGYEDDYEGGSEQSRGASPSMPTVRDVERALHPLQVTAERVGKQVELFAEHLDRLGKGGTAKAATSPTDCRQAVPSIKAYKHIAGETVKHLRTLHAPERQSQRHRSSRGKLRGNGTKDSFQNKPSTARGREPYITSLSDLDRWEQEEQTWDLFGRMIQLEYPEPEAARTQAQSFGTTRPSTAGTLHKFSPEQDIWGNFLASDDRAWEYHTVVEWLKETAEQSGEDIEGLVQELEADADRGSGIIAHSWLYTREAIKAQKRLRSWPKAFEPDDPGLDQSLQTAEKDEPLVTQLDPDAVIRQKKSLERQDLSFERAIWLACWEMLRRGKSWSYIKEWYSERAENWRAALLHGDENLLHANDTDETGWFSRLLWRKACTFAAKDGGVTEYEKAVNGILGGYLPAALQVCHNWHDQIYAYYSSYLIYSYDEHIKRNILQSNLSRGGHLNSTLDYSPLAGQHILSGGELCEKLGQTKKAEQEARLPAIALQGSFISKNFVDLALDYGWMLASLEEETSLTKLMDPLDGFSCNENADFDPEDYDFLRIVTHVILVYRDLGYDFGQGQRLAAIENVIVAYVDYLSKAGKQQLLPLYASHLSPKRCSECLARQLPMIQQADERGTTMSLMKQYGIDIARVLYTQLQLLLLDLTPDTRDDAQPTYPPLEILNEHNTEGMIRSIRAGFLGESIIEEESDLIHGFEWYLQADGFWQQTMYTGAALYKFFLRTKRYTAGRYLSQTVPFHQISLQKTYPILGHSIDISADRDWDMVLPSSNGTNKSTKKRHGHRRNDSLSQEDIDPVEIDILLRHAQSFRDLEFLFVLLNNMEDWRIMADQIIRVNRSTQAAEFKKHSGPFKEAFRRVEQSMQPLLRGWLQHPRNEEESAEFNEIRMACLPELVIAYNSILNFSSYYVGREVLKTSMDLAVLLADQEYAELTAALQQTGRMPELMDSFAVCAKSMIVAESKKPGEKSKDGRTLALFTTRGRSAAAEAEE